MQYSYCHVNLSATGIYFGLPFGRYPTFRLTFRSLSDVGRKKCFQYAKECFPLFRAIVKFCSADRLFKWFLYSPKLGGRSSYLSPQAFHGEKNALKLSHHIEACGIALRFILAVVSYIIFTIIPFRYNYWELRIKPCSHIQVSTQLFLSLS